MGKTKFLVITIFLLSVFQIYADNNKIDSLKKELSQTKQGGQILLLNTLSNELSEESPDESIKYAQKALNLSIEKNDTLNIAKSLFNIGICYYYKNDYNISKKNLLKSLDLFKTQNDTNLYYLKNYYYLGKQNYEQKEEKKTYKNLVRCIKMGQKLQNNEYIGKSFFILGLISEEKNQYKGAFNCFQKAYEKSKIINNKKLMSASAKSMGGIYYVWSDSQEALKYYLESLEIEEKLKSKKGVSSALNNIGIIYSDWKNYKKALEFYTKSLKLNIEENDKIGISKSYNNIAVIYYNLNDSVKELEYFKKALSVGIEINDSYCISTALSNIGECYYDKKQYQKSIDFYTKSLKITNTLANKDGLSIIYNQLANSYMALNKIDIAFKYFSKSLKIAKSTNKIEMIKENYKNLSESYFKIKKYKKAYQYSKIYHKIKDSIFNTRTLEQFSGIQYKFDLETRSKAIEILKKEKAYNKITIKTKKDRIKIQEIILGISFFSIFVIVIFTLFLLKGKSKREKINKLLQKQNLELKKAKEHAVESDNLKSAFLANMSHEIRTPMNAIIGFSELLFEEEIDESEKVGYSSIIKINCAFLLNLIDDILDLSKIEANQLKIFKSKFKVKPLLSELLQSYNNEKDIKGKTELEIKLNCPDEDIEILSDNARLRQVMINLLGNALKFTQKGVIEFGFFLISENTSKKIKFYVKDTGIGIPKEKELLIFDRFRQVDGSHTRKYGGSGLGLTLSKKIIELLNGEIWVESKEDVGSVFYFTLPINNNLI